MNINLRAVAANGAHTTIRVFVNGASAGLLTMKEEEAGNFHQIVANGCAKGVDTFLSDGKWGLDVEDFS